MSDGISLSGGADNITYLVGACEVLGEHGIAPTKGAGTSSGAIVIGYISQHHPEDLAEASHKARDIVLEKINGINKVSKLHFPPYLAGLSKTGIRSTKRLDAILREIIDVSLVRTSGWDVRVVATNLRRGASVAYAPECYDFITAIRMSAAYPGLLDALRFTAGAALHTDGVLNTAPIGEVIKLGADRIFSVSSADPDDIVGWDDRSPNTLDVITRVVHLMQRSGWKTDLKMVELYNLLVDAGKAPGKRKIELIDIRPSENLGKSTNFDPVEAKRAHELGREDTLAKLRDEGITGKHSHV